MKRFDLKSFTVLFFIDGDYGVETFAEHVNATDGSDAFDKAVRKAKRDGATSSGRPVRDWSAATEIVTYAGHLRPAYS